MTHISALRLLPLLLCLLWQSACSQTVGEPAGAVSYPEYPAEAVEASLESYRESALTTRRFKQSDLQPLLHELGNAFRVDTAGTSVEGRPLYRVEWGRGPTEVLLWSQMHGDEPTATAALFDLFNWLEGSGDGLDSLRQLLDRELHLTFLPMLNPDGAERFERRNALGIDLNRDALHLTSPEARVLKAERDRLDAEWGFNLHDQGVYYSVGFPKGPGAVLSILAPAFDWEKSMSDKREDAAQLIALLNARWQGYVPGRIGRYNDDFEPRAFGDNLQKWGTRTVLIESGGYPGDPEKQEIRRLNVLALIDGLHAIATGRYEQYGVADYLAIPENESNGVHALILENARVDRPEGSYVMDIGFRRSERAVGQDGRSYTSSAYVSDLGDLSTFGAFERVDLDSMRVVPGKIHPDQHSASEISRLNPREFYRQGYTAVRATATLPDPPPNMGLRILGPKDRLAGAVDIGVTLDLLVYDTAGRLKYVVADGAVIETQD
ncbi:M14 family zinc carboxypeptidase [Neolewinella litorea]|uniref:Peptidase M14 n=1 Tax=Neolewinella litorea TaxID=2562452 RepID=A0A4S4NQJ0_9BACT|nr:M14 family zinc carboxypeptidase [Neolewinella litorea]THH41427.1 peptidase M14 [Neolewinella litorea]